MFAWAGNDCVSKGQQLVQKILERAFGDPVGGYSGIQDNLVSVSINSIYIHKKKRKKKVLC